MSLSKAKNIAASKSTTKCEFCNKAFKFKSKWYFKHIEKCNSSIAKSLLSDAICTICGKVYKQKNKWFLKHLDKCKNITFTRDVSRNIETTEDRNSNTNIIHVDDKLFNFSEEFFDQTDLKLNETIDSNYDTWLNHVVDESEDKCFKIIHLNINSVFNKFEHIFTMLNNLNFDIIALNEIKLDDSVPDKLYEHSDYNVKRRNRNSNGGGIMVFIKKCYKLIDYSSSTDYEIVSFKLMLNSIASAFVFSYKPPGVNTADYLDYLDSYIKNNNLNNNLFVIGDLNMDWLSSKGDKLKMFCNEYELKNYVIEPTRVFQSINQSSSTLIDVVLHNGNNISHTSVIDFPYSDHRLIKTNCKFKAMENKAFKSYKRNLNNKAIDKIIHDINNIDFNFLNDVKDVDNRYFFFKKLIVDTMNYHAPLKFINKKHKIDSQPWFDIDLLHARRKCDKLSTIFKKTSNLCDKQNFLDSRNAYQKLLKTKKIDYYSDKTPGNIKNGKKFWEFYYSSIKIKSDKSGQGLPDTIFSNNKLYSDKKDIANVFNRHFSSFESEKDLNDTECKKYIFNTFNTKMKIDKPNKTNGEFMFSSIDKKEVLDLINQLDNKTSAGISGIPVFILKKASDKIAEPLTNLFNLCLKDKRIPTEWKTAIVTPLHKNKGTTNDVNNYRGISVLPPLSKVFEKILAIRIKKYFESCNLLFAGQHGFRAGHSCETALHELVSTCLNNLDKKKINLLLFIDFKKAFDMVDPKLLLYKLLNYGFSNDAIKLMENYFFDRQQFTKFDNSSSSTAKISLGVPQGSVLGPLLFIIFINDLPSDLVDIVSKLFADDTSLLFNGDDINEVISLYKSGLKQLNEWCKHNRLYINWSKTYIMFITNKRVKTPAFVEFDSIKVEVVEKFRLLGVLIDNKLNFNAYVAQQCLAINRKLYAINRLFYLSFEVKLQFFKTFILPYFDYGISLCIYYHKTAFRKLCKSYYLCLKKLFNFSFIKYEKGLAIVKTHDEINEFLKSYNLFSFHHRVTLRLLLFLHKICYSINSPVLLNKWLLPSSKTSTYNLRYKQVFDIDRCYTNYGDLTFKNMFTRYLNKLNFDSFDHCFIKFKNDRIGSGKLQTDLKTLIKLYPKFDCDINFYFLF